MSQKVRVHIDQKPYNLSNPISGVELYEAAHIKEGLVLYKEVSGNKEDHPIKIDDPQIHLKEEEHFHSGKAPENYYLIIVNSEPKIVKHEKVTFEEVVKFAFPNPPEGQNPEFTVTFEHANSKPHQGTLKPNHHVDVKKHGTIFDVTHTNRS